MNIYAIYINPKQKNNNFIVIKKSFSWTAAVLSVFWALYHKMWLLVIIAVAINIVAMTINILELMLALKLIVMLIFGFFASDIRENYLQRTNFTLKDIVVAGSQVEAELKFLERNSYVQ